ncbi:MAG: hypothetical protein OQK79_13635 [Rhodanobacter sp.]|nr:hypothetical protein [Rhodanobacter sp.]
MRLLTKFLAPLRRHGRLLAVVLLCAGAGLARAQSGMNDDSADPPSRVARLSYIAGDLGFLPAGASDWSDANLNRPLTTGDRLSTGDHARAELEFGSGTLRMDHRTDVALLDLNDQLAQVELTQGTLSLSVSHLDDGQSYEIDTPTVALVIDQPGTFRVDIDDRGATQVTAFDGSASVYGQNNAQRTINPGRSYRFADSSLAMVTIMDIDGGDAFDAWTEQRNRRYTQSASSQYVSDDVVGYQDLDQYGDWQDTSDYGAVWYPNQVAADWAPYRDGHWAYIAPWGWTWVDDSPWGYAPYHYGRWAYTRRGWGWIPGPRGVRPIYAPALVAFVGGGGWSVGIGTGPVGWFPLGPGEIYDPWYRASRGYYTDINADDMRERRGHDHRADIDHHYDRYRRGLPDADGHHANRDAPRGFTAVPGRTFAGGRNVRHDLVRVDARERASAPMLARDARQLRPRANPVRTPRNQHVRNLPAGGFHRGVVARHAPPVTARGARDFGHADRATGSPRAAPLVGPHIRVLDRRPVSGPIRALPGVTREPAGPPTDRRHGDAAAVRAEADLPSARFAHPQGRDNSGRRESMPRPGVSYISGAGESPRRPLSRGGPNLPAVPQIRRTEPASRITPTSEARPQRFEANRNRQPERPTRNSPMRRASEPRFQRAAPEPRSYVREAPRPMPMPARSEPPRQIMQQPRYQQPPRATAPPRAEAPRPQRNEPQPERRPRPNRREDGQRQ